MYRFERNYFLGKLQFVVSDLICIQAVFLLPYILGIWTYDYVGLQILTSLVDVCALFFLESYAHIFSRGYLKEAKSVFVSQSAVFAAVLAILFLQRTLTLYSEWTMLGMYVISLALIYAGRIIVKRISITYFKKKNHNRSIFLVTEYEKAEEVIGRIRSNKLSDFMVTGIGLIGDSGKDKVGQEVLGIPVLAVSDGITDYIKSNIVDEILLPLPTEYPVSSEIARACEKMGVVVHFMLNELGDGYGRRVVENLGGYRVLTCGANFVSARQMFFKRAMDIVGSTVGLIFTGILFIFVAPIIYIKSPDPIFFSQERIGLNGRRFKVYKFRSMYMDAEERKAELMEQNKMDGLMFKIDDDPRIIKGIGHFIRKTSIDEFPQMWNVFKGDMSLVGTRPPTVDEFEQYQYHHKSRLATKPGITGMWQVSGRSNITDFEEVVELDNKYIYNWSLGLDCRILLKTVLVVFKNEGSV